MRGRNPGSLCIRQVGLKLEFTSHVLQEAKESLALFLFLLAVKISTITAQFQKAARFFIAVRTAGAFAWAFISNCNIPGH